MFEMFCQLLGLVFLTVLSFIPALLFILYVIDFVYSKIEDKK